MKEEVHFKCENTNSTVFSVLMGGQLKLLVAVLSMEENLSLISSLIVDKAASEKVFNLK